MVLDGGLVLQRCVRCGHYAPARWGWPPERKVWLCFLHALDQALVHNAIEYLALSPKAWAFWAKRGFYDTFEQGAAIGRASGVTLRAQKMVSAIETARR